MTTNCNSTFDVSDLTNSASKSSAPAFAAELAATELSSITNDQSEDKTFGSDDEELIPDNASDATSTGAFLAQEALEHARKRAEIESNASKARLETQIREANLVEQRAHQKALDDAAVARERAQAAAQQEQYESKLRLLDAEMQAKIDSSKGSVRSRLS